MALTASRALGGQDLPVSTPGELLASDPRGFVHFLDAARPSPVSGELKARVLQGLPREGEVTDLSGVARQRLAGLGPLLRATGRDGMYTIKVIDVPQAAVAIHARVVLLISQPALRLVDAEELQALVAHEVGHEYVWTDYERASAASDHARLRDLELLCDGIAVATLHRLGIDPAHLIAGLEKLGRFNRRLSGAIKNLDDYPTEKQRREFVRAAAAWVARGDGSAPAGGRGRPGVPMTTFSGHAATRSHVASSPVDSLRRSYPFRSASSRS
jgi:hypothetical protein